MATYQERRAAQAEKLAATSLPRRIAMVIAGGITAFVGGIGMNYLLSGEPRVGIAIVAALGITGAFAYQYLVVPSRS